MRALILAAGRGSRMGSLGDDRPKCLVELDGRPLLDRQLAPLRRGGAEEIGIVSGYRAEMLNASGLSYFENKRWAEVTMGRGGACGCGASPIRSRTPKPFA